MPKALKICPKCNKSPNLVTLLASIFSFLVRLWEIKKQKNVLKCFILRRKILNVFEFLLKKIWNVFVSGLSVKFNLCLHSRFAWSTKFQRLIVYLLTERFLHKEALVFLWIFADTIDHSQHTNQCDQIGRFIGLWATF